MLLQTSRLILEPCSFEHLELLSRDEAEFSRRFGYGVAPGYLEFPDSLVYSLKVLEDNPEPGPWLAPYLIVHREDGAVIGMGGYKSPPDDHGVIEIGYGIAPAYRGRGLATEFVRALVPNAFRYDEVKVVRAHTLPQFNASNKVLLNCGFRKNGDVLDPIDGKVWRWEVSRKEFSG